MPLLGGHRLPPAPQPPARPTYGPGNMPPLPPTPAPTLAGVPKVGMPAPVALAEPPALIPPVMVMPPVLPPLPPTPLTGAPKMGAPAGQPLSAPAVRYKPTWIAVRNPSANIVQQQYVDLRLKELQANRTPAKAKALQSIETYLRTKMDPAKQQKTIPVKQLERIYDDIERNLQSADLTINFLANDWFKNENPYDTYTQMYERAIVNSRMELAKVGSNDPRRRAAVDNQVTFPQSWNGAQAPPQHGLRPGPQSPDRLMAQMDTGALVASPKTPGAFNAANGAFNPHTKQIFLGLNYGRRPHGSAKNFGWSYFTLKSDLKQRCLYFAKDTFQYENTQHHAGTLQIPYADLGSIMSFGLEPAPNRWVLNPLQMAIMQSCYEGKLLEDNNTNPGKLCMTAEDHDYLLEAHHFGQLSFRDCVEYMVISPRASFAVPNAADYNATWPNIAANAKKFADKHGFKLYQA